MADNNGSGGDSCGCLTLVERLLPTVNKLRAIPAKFGLRPYRVRLIKTRWTGGQRGFGVEEVSTIFEITPTPMVSDLSALTETLFPIGVNEQGGINVTEINPTYTEDELRGFTNGAPPGRDEQIFYEIEFPRQGSAEGDKRRFTLRSAPTYQADNFQWTLRLERAYSDRTRAGEIPLP